MILFVFVSSYFMFLCYQTIHQAVRFRVVFFCPRNLPFIRFSADRKIFNNVDAETFRFVKSKARLQKTNVEPENVNSSHFMAVENENKGERSTFISEIWWNKKEF